MRTYDRATFLAAREAWDTGDFGWQWQAIRRIAAERGFLYPPSGSVHDDREVESPSQRAIIWRALIDNPTRTEAIVRRSYSWSQVVDGIIGLEDRLRRELVEVERDEAWERKDEPTHKEAAMRLGAIIRRIGDST
jgi:hypothetical protein